jgi:gliding motility-associated-like protein
MCPGDSTQLVAGGDINSNFIWQPVDYLSDPYSFNPIANPPNSQVYTVTYTDFCGNPQSNSIEVSVEPIQVQIFPSTPELNCIEEEVTLNAYTNYENATLEWEIISGEALSVNDGTLVTDEVGVFVITSTSYDGNCSAEDSFEVLIDTTSYSAEIGDVTDINCYYPSVTLNANSDGSDAEFSWSTADGQFFGSNSTSSPTAISGGTYTLEVSNPNNGCTTTNTVSIFEDITTPEIELGFASNIISCEFPVVQISGTTINPEGYTELIEWSWSNGGLVDPFLLEPFAALPGAYSLTVTFEENGCTTTTDSVYVEQDEYAFIDVSTMALPNIFTPNGDTHNEKFIPFLTDPQFADVNPLYVLEDYYITVRNRWGHIVFENNGNPIAWDGRKNGDLVSSGTYLISVYYKSVCGEVQEGQLDVVVNIISAN